MSWVGTIFFIFHCRQALSRSAQSRRIESESYEEFTRRVIDAVRTLPAKLIDRTVASFLSRMEMVVKGKGERIKY